MIRSFRDLHIRNKLILIIVAVSSFAVLTASVLFIVNDALKFRRSVKEDLHTLAAMLGNNLRAAMTFNDPRVAEETIATLESNPRIVAAYVMTKDNDLFATYVSSHADPTRLKLNPHADHEAAPFDKQLLANLTGNADSFWNWDYVVNPIRFDNEVIGSIMIQFDSAELLYRIRWFISVIFVVMLADFMLIYVLSSKLQKIISAPIVDLSVAMKQVSDEKDYALRVHKQGNDEVGVLIDGFNDMLAQLQLHGEEVEIYRKYLEAEVAKRTAASDEWRMTFDATKDAIIMLDVDDVVMRTNKAAMTYLRAPINEVKGMSVHQLFAPCGFTPLLSPLTRSKQSRSHAEEEIHLPDKKTWFVISADPIISEKNEYNGAVLILRDISDRKIAEEAHKEVQTQLVQFQKMDSIGRLAGGIAHDFNNILSSIIGYGELALMKLPQDHPVAQNIQIICDAGVRAAALTRQLLAFSRKQIMEMKPVNINAVVGNTVKLFSRLLGEHIVLTMELHEPIRNIVADVGQLEQVLMNLMLNARDAMAEGGHLTIKTMEEGSSVILSVSDTGTGITQEVQERMFEPFFTTKERGKGTGLGLATVFGIVDQHNGAIKVNSELGKGSTFTVHFPVTDLAVDESAQNKTATMMRGTETILVVDDEPSIRSLITSVLQPLGYRIVEASGGEEALKASRDFPASIDLLLTDVVMPGMSGPTLAEMLGRERPGVKVIYISGYIDEAITTKDMANPDLVLLQKPLTSRILTTKVREVLDSNKNEASPGAPGTPGRSSVKILYADDDESVRGLVREILEPHGCEVEVCENGLLAVDKFQADHFDLVLLDLHMPVMDGLAAACAIRKWEDEQGRAPVPIIALTSADSQKDFDATLNAGCSAHLTKPIRNESLLRMVDRYSLPDKQEKADDHMRIDKFEVTIDKDLQIEVPHYLHKRREDIAAIQDALGKHDYDAIRVRGNNMKDEGGSYGFEAIMQIGSNIESAAKGRSHIIIRRSVAELQHYLEKVDVRYV
jgi:two-component system cell cycle sensor histidine kinase/response regulator CckA